MDNHKISQTLRIITDGIQTERVTLREILHAFPEHSYGLLMILFSIPMGIPLPVPPGVNVILATPLFLISGQLMMGRKTIWAPRNLQDKSISQEKFHGVIERAIPWLEWMENFIKPRLQILSTPPFRRVIGALSVLFSLVVCIPIPLTNTVPSFAIAVMAAGMMMKDGLAILFGIILGLAWIIMLGLVLYFLGTEGIDLAKDVIKSFL